MIKIDNRIPASALRHLMSTAWKTARKASAKTGDPVRLHIAQAMRKAWASHRFAIETARRHARIMAAELAVLPHIPTVITDAASDSQRDFAAKVADNVALSLARAFKEMRDNVEINERGFVDAAVANFKGAPAGFWLDLRDNYRTADVVNILCCRFAGIEHGVEDKAALRIAAMV